MRTQTLLGNALSIGGFVAAIGALDLGTAAADCASSSPPHPLAPAAVLPTNASIVVERFNVSGGLRPALEKGSLSLAGPGGPVPLRLTTAYAGGMFMEQAVLVPAKALQANGQYQLQLPGAPKPFSLQVGAQADTTPPVWRTAPQVRESSYTRMGCGPSIGVAIEVPVSDESQQVFVLAQVRPLDAPKEEPARYLLTPQKGKISLGHGMCSGAFKLKPKARYEVKLVAVDLAGNETPAPGAPLNILGPSPTDGAAPEG